MNREDIIRMAREAGFFIQQNEIYSMSTQSDQELTEWIERFAALVASAEREACAEICKKHADFYAGLEPSPIAQSAWAACVDNRDTIRAREQA
jgi:hypothetical protein